MSSAETFPWLNELNPEQRRAVCHGGGPLLVVAGAGSGKTRTLAYRVAYLIARGVDPERILLLTFTRRAAQELIRRAAEIVGRDHSNARIWGGTFHSVANRLLRIYGDAAGVPNDFTVMDQSDSADLIDVVRHELGLQSRGKRFPRKQTCLAVYSRCVNGEETLESVLGRWFPWCSDWEAELKTLFRAYVERKQQRHLLDYDDLLLYLAAVLRNERMSERIGRRFDEILVDEYQDTNRLQASILTGLSRDRGNVTVVGDDCQSIYSFRAARVENILQFPGLFEGTEQVSLEQNYRSIPPILETTNRLISQAKRRYTKELWSTRKGEDKPCLVTCRDEQDQDEFLIQTILKHFEEGIPLNRQAVLFRAAHLSNTLEVELSRRKIPYHKYGGLRFLEAAHIKDLLGFLRVVENPRDEIAWFRILQLLEGVGPAISAKILLHVASSGYQPTSVGSFGYGAPFREGLSAYASLFEDLKRAGDAGPGPQIERIQKVYDPLLANRYENVGARRQDLENLQQIASRYRSRRSFLTDLQLDPPHSTSELAGPPSRDEDWLVLSTIHSAKGGEWDVVYLIHAADGFLPSDMSAGSPEELEEELRLTYVGMTRARDRLYVTWPLRYYHKRHAFTDRHSYAQLCRFLEGPVRESMEMISPNGDLVDPGDTGSEIPAGCTEADIAAEIRSMWD